MILATLHTVLQAKIGQMSCLLHCACKLWSSCVAIMCAHRNLIAMKCVKRCTALTPLNLDNRDPVLLLLLLLLYSSLCTCAPVPLHS